MRALVTGAGGYVGGRLVVAMLDRGFDVRALVREATPRLGVDAVVGDIASAEFENLVSACEGVDTVVHLAGENEVDAAQEPAATLASTVVATERMAEAALTAGVRRFVYMSTVHVYGAQMIQGAALDEDVRPEPRASYAVARLASEHVAAGVASSEFDLVVLRLTNSVGAPDHPSVDRWTLVANDLCRQAALEGHMELRSSGVQWRDFVALSDVCSVIAAASDGDSGQLPAGVYNLGSGMPTTVLALASMIQEAFAKLTGTRPELRAPGHTGPAPRPYRVSVDRLALHGIRAETPIEDAVEETAHFCLENKEELA